MRVRVGYKGKNTFAHRRRGKFLRPRAGVIEYGGGGGERVKRGAGEAKELLYDAEALAMKQTRQELLDQTITDEADRREKEAAQQQAGMEAARSKETSEEALAAFLTEQGVKTVTAEAIAQELVREDSPYAHTELLDAKLSRLRRTLPGVDIASLISRDRKVLSTSADNNVRRLMELLEVFRAHKLNRVLSDCPALLYMESFKVRILLARWKWTE